MQPPPMRTYSKFLIIVLTAYLLFSIKFIFAAIPDSTAQFYFQQMDNRNGLSNSAVNMVLQDKDQLVWVGTWDGLNMYDGTDFKVFNYDRENKYGSIGSNVIQDIKEDLNGNIWMSTIGGITRFEKSTGKFYKYFYNQSSKGRIAEKEFILAISPEGRVFCYSKTGGLNYYDPSKTKFVPLQLPALQKLVKIETPSDNSIWILDEKGHLSFCTIQNLKIKVQKQVPDIPAITNFFIHHQKILLADQEYLYVLDQHFQKIKQISNKNRIKALTFYQSSYIIAWENQGISIYNKDFEPSALMRKEVQQLANTRVTSLNTAKNQVLWVGTDGNGLIKIYPRNNYFGLINKSSGADLSKPVRSFCEENGNLWIGTKGRGIIKIKNFWAQPKNKYNIENLNSDNGLDNNAVFALKKGIEPYIYIGTDGTGINIYDIKAKKNIRWNEISNTEKLPAFGSVYAILQDRDSTLWLGTSGSGLIHLRIKKQGSGKLGVISFKQYRSSGDSGPANDIIYALANGGDGRLWIACRYGGLSVLQKTTGNFKTFKAFAYSNSLSNNDVLSLYQDQKKQLWIGTSYGLNCLTYAESKKDKPFFLKFTMNQGLPNNTIHAIEESNAGDIWVSTNKGLARLNRDRHSIANFLESDGLQSNEFSDGAVWKSAAGYLFFGGIYGFNYFEPQKITGTALQANILISTLQMGGKTINENRIQVLSTTQNEIPEYILDRKANFFQISLKSMSYLNPAKNEFSYKLEGLDKDWNYSGSLGNIIYNNIPPGHYTMMVKWSNGEGGWTVGTRVFKLQVNQYFWVTYPALLLYLLILSISGYVFYSYRKNKLKMKYQLEMEHLLRQKDETVHQQRLNFFTNIAHEIQTPLTMIMGSIEHFLQSKKNELLKNKENNYLFSLIHQHTVRLTYLVQQLMEFRKAESGYLTKNEDYVDLTKMLNSLSELFMTEHLQHKRKYIREIEEGMAGFIDKDKFEKILFNLLSNAFKHSGKEDTVVFKAHYLPGTTNLNILVSNSGCRLNPKELDRLFDQFFVSNQQPQQKFSTGIGLAFTKELVSLLNASITVEMQEDWIHFKLTIHLEPTQAAGKIEEVITSAPSIAFQSLVQHHELPSSGEENKNSLIDKLHQKDLPGILVVEDEPELRYLLKNILKEHYIIYEAGTGNEALSFLRKTTPDLIISDVMMPDMDGIQLCQEVKNTPAIAQIPFIILSARGTTEHKTEGYEVGADAYIPKPFHINYLLVRIKKLLDYQHKMQNLIKDQNITNQFMDADLAETDKKFLETLLKVIENNLDETDLNAATLEEALSISKMQLYRRLKSLTGMTPAEFIKRVRLKHAADMLIASQFTVSEIFYRTGFNNKSYFFREFKKIYRCAPNEYRQQQYEANTPSM